MSNLITLTCPSCGGRLEVTNNTERYVCVHCGNAHIVDPGVRAESLAREVEVLKYSERIRKIEADLEGLVIQQRRAWQALESAEAQLAQYRSKKMSGLLASGIGVVLVLLGLVLGDVSRFLLVFGAVFVVGGVREIAVNDFEARVARESATQQVAASRDMLNQKQRQLAQYRAGQLALQRQLSESVTSTNPKH
jgi:predicted RNA-binding Zn-ribbon protein involved in translation (DUF1610 family)